MFVNQRRSSKGRKTSGDLEIRQSSVLYTPHAATSRPRRRSAHAPRRLADEQIEKPLPPRRPPNLCARTSMSTTSIPGRCGPVLILVVDMSQQQLIQIINILSREWQRSQKPCAGSHLHTAKRRSTTAHDANTARTKLRPRAASPPPLSVTEIAHRLSPRPRSGRLGAHDGGEGRREVTVGPDEREGFLRDTGTDNGRLRGAQWKE